MAQTVLTRDTFIPIGAVVIVLTAAFSYGIMYNKVQTLSDEVSQLRVEVAQINSTLNQLVGKLNTYSYGGKEPNTNVY